MIRHLECVEVLCDDCESGYWDGDVWDGGIPHFASEEAARQCAVELGWDVGPVVDPELGRGGLVLCPSCSAHRICATHGHTFLPPADCRCQGRLPQHRDGCTPWRDCAMCGHVEPAEPADHGDLSGDPEGGAVR